MDGDPFAIGLDPMQHWSLHILLHPVSVVLLIQVFHRMMPSLRMDVGTTGQIRKQTKLKKCIEMSLENWQRLPNSLIAKAWIMTGLVSKDGMLEAFALSEED